MRTEFYYKGILVKLVKQEDGWRFYEGDGVKIKVKGVKIEVWQQ